MSRMDELDEMIRLGWGDRTQDSIPDDWRTSKISLEPTEWFTGKLSAPGHSPEISPEAAEALAVLEAAKARTKEKHAAARRRRNAWNMGMAKRFNPQYREAKQANLREKMKRRET